MHVSQQNDEAIKQLEQLILENMDKVPQERRLPYREVGELLDQIHAQGRSES